MLKNTYTKEIKQKTTKPFSLWSMSMLSSEPCSFSRSSTFHPPRSWSRSASLFRSSFSWFLLRSSANCRSKSYCQYKKQQLFEKEIQCKLYNKFRSYHKLIFVFITIASHTIGWYVTKSAAELCCCIQYDTTLKGILFHTF